MHARVSTLEIDPSGIDEVARGLEENDIPEFEKADGYKGFTLLVDRQGGKVVGVSFWESEDALRASEEQGKAARERAVESSGASGTPEVDRFEVAIDKMV